jgi:hypothetical protein
MLSSLSSSASKLRDDDAADSALGAGHCCCQWGFSCCSRCCVAVGLRNEAAVSSSAAECDGAAGLRWLQRLPLLPLLPDAPAPALAAAAAAAAAAAVEPRGCRLPGEASLLRFWGLLQGLRPGLPPNLPPLLLPPLWAARAWQPTAAAAAAAAAAATALAAAAALLGGSLPCRAFLGGECSRKPASAAAAATDSAAARRRSSYWRRACACIAVSAWRSCRYALPGETACSRRAVLCGRASSAGAVIKQSTQG